MIDRKLLARIRKCLALSKSSNEHEAAASLAKARELMEEHGITDAMLQMAEIEEATARSAGTRTPALWHRYLIAVVKRALHVEAFLDGNDWRFVGRGPTAEIASYAFASLFRRLKAARAEYIGTTLRRCSPGRKRVRADAFCEGWAQTVHRKVAALSPEREPDEAVGDYLAVQYPGLVACRPARSGAGAARVANDYWRGVSAGRSVDLHHGVAGFSRPGALAHG